MNTVPLRELTVLLEKELYRLRYGRQTIKYYHRMWKHIITFCESEGVDHFTEDPGMRFLDRRYNFSELEKAGALTQSIVNAFRVVRMIGDFQQHGSILRRYYKQKELLQQDGFKAILQNYEHHCRQREYAKVTQKHYRDTGEQFLSYVESQGIKHIADITGTQVAGYINTLLGYSYKTVELQLCALRSFFGYLYANELHTTESGGNHTVHQGQEAQPDPLGMDKGYGHQNARCDRQGQSCREKGLRHDPLAARLGLRTMDIKHLTLDNLKWHDNRIEFMQSKTSRMLSLPLLPDVGWAIIDYLKNGRPKVDSPYVFLRHLAPLEPFSDDDRLHQIVVEIHETGQNPSALPRRRKACIPSVTRWQAGCSRRTLRCPSSRTYWGTSVRIRQRSISRWTLPCCANARSIPRRCSLS